MNKLRFLLNERNVNLLQVLSESKYSEYFVRIRFYLVAEVNYIHELSKFSFHKYYV